MSYEYGKDITDYINELSNDAEISGLYTDVNTRFEQLCSSNQKLGEFMKKINGAAALHSTSGNETAPTDSTDAAQSAQTAGEESDSADTTDGGADTAATEGAA